MSVCSRSKRAPKSPAGNLLARQTTPTPARGQKSAIRCASFGVFKPAGRSENLARLFPPFLADAARQIDAEDHIESAWSS